MPPTQLLIPLPWTVLATAAQEPKSQPDQPSPTPGGAPQDPGSGPAGAGGTGTGTGQPATQQPGVGDLCGGQPLVMIGLFLLLMWFMVLRPESKRRKQTQQMLAALKQGDRVVTLGGLHGVVASIAERTVTLRFDDLKIVFDRSAIARVERDEPDGPAKKP